MDAEVEGDRWSAGGVVFHPHLDRHQGAGIDLRLVGSAIVRVDRETAPGCPDVLPAARGCFELAAVVGKEAPRTMNPGHRGGDDGGGEAAGIGSGVVYV